MTAFHPHSPESEPKRRAQALAQRLSKFIGGRGEEQDAHFGTAEFDVTAIYAERNEIKIMGRNFKVFGVTLDSFSGWSAVEDTLTVVDLNGGVRLCTPWGNLLILHPPDKTADSANENAQRSVVE